MPRFRYVAVATLCVVLAVVKYLYVCATTNVGRLVDAFGKAYDEHGWLLAEVFDILCEEALFQIRSLAITIKTLNFRALAPELQQQLIELGGIVYEYASIAFFNLPTNQQRQLAELGSIAYDYASFAFLIISRYVRAIHFVLVRIVRLIRLAHALGAGPFRLILIPLRFLWNTILRAFW